jgi:hypothetical protein
MFEKTGPKCLKKENDGYNYLNANIRRPKSTLMSQILLPDQVNTTLPPLQDRVVTLREVALAAGVSLMTASVIMRDKPGVPVASKTRRRVLDAAEQLGYRPISRRVR